MADSAENIDPFSVPSRLPTIVPTSLIEPGGVADFFFEILSHCFRFFLTKLLEESFFVVVVSLMAFFFFLMEPRILNVCGLL